MFKTHCNCQFIFSTWSLILFFRILAPHGEYEIAFCTSAKCNGLEEYCIYDVILMIHYIYISFRCRIFHNITSHFDVYLTGGITNSTNNISNEQLTSTTDFPHTHTLRPKHIWYFGTSSYIEHIKCVHQW